MPRRVRTGTGGDRPHSAATGWRVTSSAASILFAAVAGIQLQHDAPQYVIRTAFQDFSGQTSASASNPTRSSACSPLCRLRPRTGRLPASPSTPSRLLLPFCSSPADPPDEARFTYSSGPRPTPRLTPCVSPQALRPTEMSLLEARPSRSPPPRAASSALCCMPAMAIVDWRLPPATSPATGPGMPRLTRPPAWSRRARPPHTNR